MERCNELIEKCGGGLKSIADMVSKIDSLPSDLHPNFLNYVGFLEGKTQNPTVGSIL